MKKNKNKMSSNFYKKQYQTQLKLMIINNKSNNSLSRKLSALKILKTTMRFHKNNKNFS